MSPDITVVYLTHRLDPRFEWFADSFATQIDDDDVEVVLVDGHYSSQRTTQFEAAVRARFPFRHVPAKPTPYAGPYRRTSRDFFSASSARNTGILHATARYVAFVDDLSVVMPGWWTEVQSAAKAELVIAGAYQKHRQMIVSEGVLRSSVLAEDGHDGLDSRWLQGSDTRLVAIPGGQLFGCSFGAPRALLLEVNGFDELCDSIGGEDWHLGVRLEWAGGRIFYSRRMLTIESEELHHVGVSVPRVDKTVPRRVYLRRLREFGIDARQFEGNWDSSHMVLDILYGTRSTQTLGNYYLLSSLAPEHVHQTIRRFPRVHWFDGQPLAQL